MQKDTVAGQTVDTSVISSQSVMAPLLNVWSRSHCFTGTQRSLVFWVTSKPHSLQLMIRNKYSVRFCLLSRSTNDIYFTAVSQARIDSTVFIHVNHRLSAARREQSLLSVPGASLTPGGVASVLQFSSTMDRAVVRVTYQGANKALCDPDGQHTVIYITQTTYFNGLLYIPLSTVIS